MINIQTQILKTLEKMPLSLQEKLLYYAEYLQEKYNQSNITQLNSSNVVNDCPVSWHETMIGQTIPISQLWEYLEKDKESENYNIC
ncbi:DUF2281 domain-containing protein [Geminocystis herdmanii]|uniref:DUF2281 domain-containing protein n=1 Tax=Geminocystis herdmanii TaxID=669359 RepID=UPI00034CC7DF|nr:DUF2281 domain-containing protein [Geminocystis herdmanii]